MPRADALPPPLPAPLERQLTDRLKAVLDVQLADLPAADDEAAAVPEPLEVQDL